MIEDEYISKEDYANLKDIVKYILESSDKELLSFIRENFNELYRDKLAKLLFYIDDYLQEDDWKYKRKIRSEVL